MSKNSQRNQVQEEDSDELNISYGYDYADTEIGGSVINSRREGSPGGGPIVGTTGGYGTEKDDEEFI